MPKKYINFSSPKKYLIPSESYMQEALDLVHSTQIRILI